MNRLRPTLLAIASEFPPFEVSQQEAWGLVFKRLAVQVPFAERLVEATGVQKRHIIWDPREIDAACRLPVGDRMKAHSAAMLDVSALSMQRVMAEVDRRRIGSLVMASSTGYTNPGPDLMLARMLELRSDLRRTFIGHMGCYAAGNVIKVALDSLAARPDELVACNCTELSSTHVRDTPMPGEDLTESLITQALFGDASVSMLLGNAPDGEGVQFLRTHTEQIYEAHSLMTLNIGNQSFWMTLAAGVPSVLQENVEGYLDKLLRPEGLARSDISHWIIHPGGPKILRVLAKQLRLDKARLRASWDVLANYGNCASATVLLVLENVLKHDQPRRGEHGIMLTFGPGLTIEGALLRF